MKRNLKVGIVQQHNSADVNNNRRNLCDKIRKLAADGAQLIVLQELHDSLYFCQTENPENFDLAVAGNNSGAAHIYSELAAELKVVIITSMFERRAAGLYHNTAYVYDTDGHLDGYYRKMHIPDDPAYYEKFYFAPGDLGFRPIETSIGRIGVLICWDQWYPEAARLMALAGAELLIYPTAIGWESTDTNDEKDRQRDAWMTVQRGHAVANGLPVITVNRVGYEPDPSGATGGINFWGTSFVAGSQGELIFCAPDDTEIESIINIDLGRCEQVRRWWPFLRDRRIDAYGDIIRRFID